MHEVCSVLVVLSFLLDCHGVSGPGCSKQRRIFPAKDQSQGQVEPHAALSGSSL